MYLADDLLLYLAAVICVTLVGGFVPAIVAAVASSLLLNWYFTPPVHTWTIDSPQNLLALVLFVAVAVTVGSVVHLAARRAGACRRRSRPQAARAQGLAEGNRIRTTLLAAVGHDLRTPLASVKASVSTLRQTDVTWSAQDQADLLATIEEGADRLNALIGNLLDMSRIQTGALQLFVRPTSLEEVAPLVVEAVDGGALLRVEMSEDLPLFCGRSWAARARARESRRECAALFPAGPAADACRPRGARTVRLMRHRQDRGHRSRPRRAARPVGADRRALRAAR